MLVQYSVTNFLSFKDEVTLSMAASKRRSKHPGLDEGAIWPVDESTNLLKCAVIYGANNSGKSNLIKSLQFLKQLVLDSSKESRANADIKVRPFLLNPESETAPSSFEIIFLQDRNLFQYEVTLTRSRVEKERLSRRALKKNAVTVELFAREGANIKVGRSFKEGKGLEQRTRANALFLSVCANFDGLISTSVTEWFSRVRVVSGLNDSRPLAWTASNLDHPEMGGAIHQWLKAFDLGIDRFEAGDSIPGFKIEGVETKEVEGEAGAPPAEDVGALAAVLGSLNRVPSRKVVSYHKVFTDEGEFVRDIPFDLTANESAGTRKLVALAGPMVDTINSALVLVVDEFESRLHTSITSAILRMFNTREGNPNGAQLIAATHDTNLLSGDYLRRDQVWFTGRDGLGRTSLRSLVEYKVRNDASFEKNYLDGDYGGIPFLRPELTDRLSLRDRVAE